jgi:arylsulfatase A-like enzyme
MSKLGFKLTVLFFCFATIGNVQAKKNPNVILIMTDDQGYGDLSCHGNPILKTPHIDQLHDEAIRFTDFHVSSYCTPTRAALMTGHYPGYTGAYSTSNGRMMMHRDEKTIANFFSDAGYITGMSGKWHLGDCAPHRPQDRGFDEVVWHRCGGVGQASDYWGNDYFDDTYERNGKFEKFEGYCTDVWFKEGMRFIEENKESPFFLYLALNAPHYPYYVDEKWSAPYKDEEDIPSAEFYGMIANIDYNIGVLRKFLSDNELDENTILIFMTDNGTSGWGQFKSLDDWPYKGYNAGMRGRKSSVYEGGHRVPFFIYWPKGGLKGGKDIDNLAGHIDVLPTLADLCDVKLPEDYKSHGLSLKPLLYGKQKKWKREYMVEHFLGRDQGKPGTVIPYRMTTIMTEKWRLVNSHQECLYDIEKDPGQRTDLIKQYPEVTSKLRALNDSYWELVSPRITPVRIDIGNPAENPINLCSQEWYMPNGGSPWNFSQINRLPKVTGPWMLEVQKTGRYRITLRQYPKEADKLVVGVKAEMEIAGQKLVKEIPAGSKGVVFEVDLPQGPTELVTKIYNDKGEAGGAYFTEVEAL